MKTRLATRLRQLRAERKMTMEQVATALQVSRSTYRDWEYGRKMPAMMLLSLAEVFGVSINDLAGIQKDSEAERQAQAIRWIEEGLKLLKRSQ